MVGADRGHEFIALRGGRSFWFRERDYERECAMGKLTSQNDAQWSEKNSTKLRKKINVFEEPIQKMSTQIFVKKIPDLSNIFV